MQSLHVFCVVIRVDVEMGFGHGMALEQGGYQFGVWQFSPTDNNHSDDRYTLHD